MKMDKIMKKRGHKALKLQKQQMACEILKMASAMHTVVFVDWALEAKSAQVTCESATFDGHMEGKNLNGKNKGTIGIEE